MKLEGLSEVPGIFGLGLCSCFTLMVRYWGTGLVRVKMQSQIEYQHD